MAIIPIQAVDGSLVSLDTSVSAPEWYAIQPLTRGESAAQHRAMRNLPLLPSDIASTQLGLVLALTGRSGVNKTAARTMYRNDSIAKRIASVADITALQATLDSLSIPQREVETQVENALASSGSSWIPNQLPGFAHWYPPSGAALNRQGPSFPSQPGQTHLRGLNFDGTDDVVDLGNNALYNSGAVALSITLLAFIDSAAQAGSNVLYCESNTGVVTQQLVIGCTTAAGQIVITLRDNSGAFTIVATTVAAAVTNGAWNVITLVLDAAGTGWGLVVNGTAVKALGTAYDAAPAATTFDSASIGALITTTTVDFFAGPVGYTLRHSAALTLAQARQVQQYVADAVAADGITLTIAGGESANSNTPTNDWPFSEDTDGDDMLDIAGAVVGVRVPGDTVSVADDLVSGLGDNLVQATPSRQPQFTWNRVAADTPAISPIGTANNFLRGAFTNGGAIAQPFMIGLAVNCDVWTGTLFDSSSGGVCAVRLQGINLVMDAGGVVQTIANAGILTGRQTMIFVFNGANSKAWVGGSGSLVAATPGANGLAGLTLGNNVAATDPQKVDVVDWVVATGAPTNANVDLLGNYLAALQSLTWTPVL